MFDPTGQDETTNSRRVTTRDNKTRSDSRQTIFHSTIPGGH
jgi:hypothetical protein